MIENPCTVLLYYSSQDWKIRQHLIYALLSKGGGLILFVKCSNCEIGGHTFIHFPETDQYEFRYRFEDGLYLILPNKEVKLLDVDMMCSGKSIPTYEVEALYCDSIDTIAETLINNEKISVIDIDEIESKLLTETYEQRWISLQYISPDENGCW